MKKNRSKDVQDEERVPQVQIEINIVANVSTKIKSSIRISHETEAQRQSRKLNYIEINWTNANRNTHTHNTRIEILKYQYHLRNGMDSNALRCALAPSPFFSHLLPSYIYHVTFTIQCKHVVHYDFSLRNFYRLVRAS